MADQREAVEMAKRIVADETGKETASAWQVEHVDGRNMSTKYGEGADALVFLHREDAVDKAFDEVESYLNADIAKIDELVTIEPLGPWVPLARAVIALDEEVGRLRGEADQGADATAERIATWLDRCGGGMQSVARDIRGRSWRPAQHAPSSPGASEASDADVERVARRLYVSQWDGPIDAAEKAWSGSSLATKKNWRELAREAIRLGAKVPG